MSAFQVDGIIKVKEKTTESGSCPRCGTKSEAREHEATYEVDVIVGAAQKKTIAEVSDRTLFNGVVTYIDGLSAEQTKGDARYATARSACAALVDLIDQRAKTEAKTESK